MKKTEKDGKKKRFHMSLRKYLMLIVLCLLIAFYVATSQLVSLLSLSLENMSLFLRVLFGAVVCLALGGGFSFLIAQITMPIIKHLKHAMEKVAGGDFDVTLDEDSSIEEVEDLYHNFNQMVKELSSIETLQTDFISEVSHEFKTPINAIEGYTMLLQGDSNLSEEQVEYVDKILYNTRRLLTLTSNILLLSKINNQVIPAKFAKFRLDEQIRQVIVALEDKWTAKDIDLDVDMDEVRYEGNETLLFHVWSNLIDNAIKFDPVHGKVEIRLTKQENMVRFMVRDTGPGIDEDERRKIFEKFYQSDTEHMDEGNGLGLALVKRITALHGGDISVENCPECGCMFTVELPIYKQEKKKET